MSEEYERACMYRLFCAPGAGQRTCEQILYAAGSAETACREYERMSAFVNTRFRESFLKHFRDPATAASYDKIMSKGIHFTALPLSDYPEKLKAIHDPPFGITWIGELPDSTKPAVSVIGARQCSAYGRFMAGRFGSDLAAAGIQVISGMAVGIDGLAQRACVNAGGRSFAVLGSGVDVCYPGENSDLYEKLKTCGGIISENPPGTAPRKQLFPMRNRLISAFCDALLVIEARKRSGTLITVDMALEQGKDIFALPGRVTDALSDGCNQLIRQGAGIATCVSDITDALFYINTENTDDYVLFDRNEGLSSDERLILGVLDASPRSVTDISSELEALDQSRSTGTLMELLMELCAKGAVIHEGGYFSLRLCERPGSRQEEPSQ
ncbi:MAG: DNA-processing protein DprA [Lachnospiraceae bacterium]|nr:DNA-processing protein DprA [Lachnospiraceae bacterium]